MKNIIFPIVFMLLFTACNGGSTALDNYDEKNDSTTNNISTDSISVTLNRIDSIQNKKELAHIETWDIGSLKTIEIRVLKVSAEKDSIMCIQLRKDCGNEYYYSWEETPILKEELPSFYRAIDIIKKNLDRETDHNERYVYFTKSNVAVYAESSGKGWGLKLSVNSRVKNSYINISIAELDRFVELLQIANTKMDELSHVKGF